MPSMSSGKIVKKRTAKGGTAHTKNHRWESFAVKIAKFNSLDPLRRVRRHNLDAEDISTRTSYFKDGLERWQDLNLSATFVDFAYAATPISDSLPQILHFEDKIADLLIEGLEKNDRQAYEPLLSLMTDFAHDIGTRFEKHYERTLKVVASIVAAPQDVEVIEWGFTCLAFLFKYLSKLLVSDLRQTYDLMAPLLGKERQRPHIARFAAESMSFLLKRAGASATRKEALTDFMRHVKHDLLSTKETKHFVLYYHGVMTMLSESMKGNGFALHTSAGSILQSILSCSDENDFSVTAPTAWNDVTCGVLTSIVHHTSTETIQPVMEVLLQFIESSIRSATYQWTADNIGRILFSSRILGVLTGVRQGSRVPNWDLLLSTIQDILKLFSRNSSNINFVGLSLLWKCLVSTVSQILQYAPMNAIIPKMADIMSTLTKDPLASLFLTFCSYLANRDTERFQSVVYPSFQRFVVSHWSDPSNEDTLCILLPELASIGVLNTNERERYQLPQSWQDQIVSKFEKLEVSPFPEQAPASTYDRGPQVWHERCLPKYRALLLVLECTNVHPSTNARIAEILLRKLKLALRPSSSLATSEAHFIMGRGFEAYIRMSNSCGKPEKSLGLLLRAAASRYSYLPRFVNAMISYERSVAEPLETQQEDHDNSVMVNALVQNLSTFSHDLRLLSMRLLEILYSEDKSILEGLKIMLMVESTPMDLSTARLASLHIRKLASTYASLEPTSILIRAIPAFCFGMMTVRFTQLWTDAGSALAEIAGTKLGEEAVTTKAFDWLTMPSQQREDVRNTAEEHDSGLTDFECSNLMQLTQVADDVYNNIKNAQDLMLRHFEDEQALIVATPPNARTQALKVFSTMSSLGEKHSRQLVPMFLSWASHVIPSSQNESDGLPSDWNRKDQKALLDLFASFKNPRVLFRSQEVFSALLNLLANGELEIQKSALTAVLSWRLPGVRPYEENLHNLLDEARFKEEIALLFQSESPIQPEHRGELRPILLRLLYGRSISRKGAASGKQGMEARRLIILRSLDTQDIGIFLDIALGELGSIRLPTNMGINDSLFGREIISVRKQVGFMHMVEPVIRELGSKIEPFIGAILTAILYCMVAASRRLNPTSEAQSDENETSQDSLLKVIRQSGYRCLVQIFSNGLSVQHEEFVPLILRELISPKLEDLPIEIAQGVSGLLQLLSTWSTSTKTVLFLADDLRILPKLIDSLAPTKTQEAVKLFILNIIHNLLMAAQGSSDDVNVASRVRTGLLEPNLDRMLRVIGGVLRTQQNGSKALLEANISTIVELAPFVSSSAEARNLVDISVFLLNQPSRRVNPKVKNRLLSVLEHFIPLYELQDDQDLRNGVYNTISSLFGFFKDHASRDVLSNVLQVFARIDPVLNVVAEHCKDLNSFKEGKLNEPDYDRRLRAFTRLEQETSVQLTPYQWRPLLYNMLFFIKDDEEFGVLASNSSDGLCNFLDVAVRSADETSITLFNGMISDILLPAIFSGVREPSEVTRREYVKVMAHLVKVFPMRSDISDLYSLLRGDEELESSFFNNILSAGKGRQSSALGQLASYADNGDLSSRNVSQFFIPLLEFFVFDRAEGSEAHNLAAEASTTIAALANCLEWLQFRALLKRYITYITSKPELEKQIIRLVGRIIDTLAANALDAHAAASFNESRQEEITNESKKKLAATLPTRAKFSDELISNVLPQLSEYVHGKDESTVSLRVPVAIILVRLFKLLPEDQLNDKLPAVLTDICHILRSKAQESRDMARDTLTKICVLLGPSCFGFVLKELRGALARGYQLHVLSYTMHSILVATTPNYVPGDLDYCLPSIVAIIMDDIFGVTGQEKDAEEYVSKMKEVKSSKSRDSMELIAKTATLRRLTEIIRPIRTLLREKLNMRMVHKIDDLLSRVSTGLLQNPAVNSQDSLIFCYEVIHDSYAVDKPQEKHKENYKLKKYLIQKGAAKSGNRATTTINLHKLVSFSFDILRMVLRKYDHLRNEANLAGFIPLFGDGLTNGEEEVKIAVFKLLTGIVKVPLKTQSASDLYKLGAAEGIKCLAASSSTKSDLAQAALKLLSAILKDRRDVSIKDTSVDEIINKLKDDVTNPELRHVTFNFLRSVLDSKMQTATVYDMLDYVGTVMVTNDDKDTRDLARGAYFQFLRDYPQMKKRWTKQLNFIVANLRYDREGGRLSVLEVVLLLLSKSSDEFAQETAATCFLPLVLVLVNDESEKCRVAAGAVIQEIFRKADDDRLQTFLGLLRGWIVQYDNSPVLQLALQAYAFGVRTRSQEILGDLPAIRLALLAVLSGIEDTSEWEILHAALGLAFDILETVPGWIFAGDQEDLWKTIQRCLSFPHISVKLSASRLVGALMTDFAKSNIERGLVLPLKGSMGLELSKDGARDLIRRFARMLRTPELTEQLAAEIVKNLAFLGRTADISQLEWITTEDLDEDDDTVAELKQKPTALGYLCGRLSFILRRETSPPRAMALIPKISAMHLLQLLTSKLSSETLPLLLPMILLPLHNLTDPSIPTPYSTDDQFKAGYERLKSDSQELMSSLQGRCGTSVYTAQLMQLRQGIKNRRLERTSKRRIEAISAPEKYGKDKKKKVERKKERRKERGQEHRDLRRAY